jgi:hypothetical protein
MGTSDGIKWVAGNGLQRSRRGPQCAFKKQIAREFLDQALGCSMQLHAARRLLLIDSVK